MREGFAVRIVLALICMSFLFSGCVQEPERDSEKGSGGASEESDTAFQTEPISNVQPRRQNGSFRSDTGTGLNLRGEWGAEGDGELRLTLKIYLEHFSLSVGEWYGAYAGSIRVGGATERTFSTPAIHTSQNEFQSDLLKTETYLFRPDELPDGEIPLVVTWRFGGTYAGKEIGSVTARGSISLAKG